MPHSLLAAFCWPCLAMVALPVMGAERMPESDHDPVLSHQELAGAAQEVLSTYCGSCHRDSDDGGIDYIEELASLVDRKKVVPGNPGQSRIWRRMVDDADPMPPEDEEPRPSDQDKAIIESWIESLGQAEAKLPATTQKQPEEKLEEADQRELVSTSDVIASVHRYLSKVDESDRRYQRFFVLNHLHNMPNDSSDGIRGVSRKQLNQVRAAVSKTINSLSWSPDIVLPRPIDQDKTVMVIDTRDLGWNENRRQGNPALWDVLLQEYPYALMHHQYPDIASSQMQASEIYRWTKTSYPWIRADWFVATATQPHLYHALLYDTVFPDVRHRKPRSVSHADAVERLEQPMNADDLYDVLRVNLDSSLRRGRVARAGFTRSGVSSQPRLLERVSASYGYLWGSYDFKRGNPTMNLNARPLGPKGALSERFESQAFQHDGGEIIFGLPNGLHGYLLITETGDRIPQGPVDIVEDRAKTLGNGI
ncbi:MAG: c-type cytochrome domain-containing protein, partial [Planctomycetota bacterium]